jgi:hypothetical protein
MLRLMGAFISKLEFAPSKAVRINMLRAPTEASERQVTILRDLQFHDVRQFHCDFNAEPWLEITSHATLERSDFLRQYRATQEESETIPEMFHFQITCDEGIIDIIARRFTCSIIEEIPHHGVSESVPED